MKQVPIFLSIMAILLLCSCSSVPKNWQGTNLGGNGTHGASVTHNYALKWVDEALVEVLDQMEIIVIEATPSIYGKSIKAATFDQDITIELKSVTQSSTHMQIDITLAGSEEHASLGNEIMAQTEKYLLGNSQIDTTSFAEGIDIDKENLPAK
jgi:hypothetical protein